MTPDERADFIVKVLDVVQCGIYPSEEEIAALEPSVAAIKDRYASMRSKSFSLASHTSRAEFIASAIRAAENEALERAAKELAMYEDEASGHTEEEWAFGKAVEVVRALKHQEP